MYVCMHVGHEERTCGLVNKGISVYYMLSATQINKIPMTCIIGFR